MKKAFKISMILLLFGITGTGSLAAKDVNYTSPVTDLILLSDDKEKGSAEKGEQPESGEPYFKTNEEELSVNLLNLDANPVEVSIYDAYNRVVFTQVITGQSIGKRFDFSEAKAGVYTIQVKDNNKNYYKKVQKL